MTIGLKGLFTPEAPEDRDIAYLEVVHNGLTYDWSAYIPRGVNVSDHLVTIENAVYADIDAKEAKWAALDPKTRTIVDPISQEEKTVPIDKSEIVRPDFPDYYALRRAEYPPLGDQLGALWKGIDSPEYADLLRKIQEIKDKYPKP